MFDWFSAILIVFFGIVSSFLGIILLNEHVLYKRSERIIKEHSKTFYKAFSKIKDIKKRRAVYVVYAFCREADDAWDKHQSIQQLNALKLKLDQYLTGDIPRDKTFQALGLLHERFYQHYDYQAFYDMIEGQMMDANFQTYETMEDLLKYCYHVASSVGLMLLPVLAPKKVETLTPFAIKLGYAMQLTNILRDVGEDARRGYVYLPQVMLQQTNITKNDLLKGHITPSFIEVFEAIAKVAESYYDEALKDIHEFDDDVKLPLHAAAILYRDILTSCRASNYDVFTQKNYVSEERKEQLIKTLLKESSYGHLGH
jgi:15-cis-phytoene synthase